MQSPKLVSLRLETQNSMKERKVWLPARRQKYYKGCHLKRRCTLLSKGTAVQGQPTGAGIQESKYPNLTLLPLNPSAEAKRELEDKEAHLFRQVHHY